MRGLIFFLLKWGGVRVLLDFGVPNLFLKCFQLHSQHVPQVPNVFKIRVKIRYVLEKKKKRKKKHIQDTHNSFVFQKA